MKAKFDFGLNYSVYMPTDDEKKLIAVRAKEIYDERINNGDQGDEMSDWLNAEKQLIGEGVIKVEIEKKPF
jgi:hypothetical protein